MEKIISVLLIIALAAVTYSRNTIWHDKIPLWEDVIGKSPRKRRAYNDLGYYYFKQGMLDKALLQFHKTILLNPNYANGYCNMGAVYLKKGSLDRAINYFERAVALAPRLGIAYFNLGLAYKSKGDLDKSDDFFKKACFLETAMHVLL